MSDNKAAHGNTDVLVVGGRTTGLMLAIQLARQGLRTRIVDASPGIDPHSRATLLHSRSLELLENLDITAEVVRKGQVLRGMRLFVDGQFVMKTEDPPVDSPYPFGIAFSQMKIESLLESKLKKLGIEVERNTGLVGLEQNNSSVLARLRHYDGCEDLVEASWMVGCDGAHSTTRHLLGVEFPGTQSPYPYILADVVAQNDAPSDAWFYFLHQEGSLIFAILDGGRRQIFGTLPEDHPAKGSPDLAELQSIVDRRTEGAYRLSDPRWLTYFRIHYRLADQFRLGRVFLAGDAAHLNSLVGGHGMNTGIQDACNLAWKLAFVHRGVTSAAILNSYETERRPVAEEMVDGSRNFTEPGEKFPSMSAEERDAMVRRFRRSPDDLIAFRRNFEELDLDYGDSSISCDGGTNLPEKLRPGLEARDVSPLRHMGRNRRLFHFLGGPNYCLLIFVGECISLDKAYSKAREAGERYGSWIDIHVVVRAIEDEHQNNGISSLLDREDRLTGLYGMDHGGLYLIRPDGYVAYRTKQLEGFTAYIEKVLLAK